MNTPTLINELHKHVLQSQERREDKMSFCFTVDAYVATMNPRVSGRLPSVKS